MEIFLKMFASLAGKEGRKKLLNMLLSTEMFKSAAYNLIMGRLSGLQKYPELYATMQGYATAVSNLPDILTDDNSEDVEQVAAMLRLKIEALTQNLAEVTELSRKAGGAVRAVTIKLPKP
jgi:hypothetical protein